MPPRSRKNTRLLITRFPLESAWGGEEEIHVLMAKIFRKHGVEAELLSSCSHLTRAFREEGFFVRKEFQKDITSRSQLLWSVLTVPFFLLRGIGCLFYFRFIRGVRTVLFLTLVEKVVWTPLARLFGMRVFWGHHAPVGRWLFRNPYFFLWKWWSRMAKILVASEFMKRSLSQFVKSSRISVLPNTLSPEKDFSRTKSGPLSETDFRNFLQRKIGKDPRRKESFLVGSAGRLSREKGMFDLLEAARIFRKKHPDVLFLCAGQGPEEAALKREIEKFEMEDTVFLLGFLTNEELRIFFSGIDLFVLPSRQEPFGIVLLEAMSAVKAIVATNTGGVPEVLGAENAGLFPPQTPASCARKIEMFLRDHDIRKEWAQKNSRRFQTHFSLRKFEKNLQAVFSLEVEHKNDTKKPL